jgi:hypothetical protein
LGNHSVEAPSAPALSSKLDVSTLIMSEICKKSIAEGKWSFRQSAVDQNWTHDFFGLCSLMNYLLFICKAIYSETA